jgi:hypothetical protein
VRREIPGTEEAQEVRIVAGNTGLVEASEGRASEEKGREGRIR